MPCPTLALEHLRFCRNALIYLSFARSSIHTRVGQSEQGPRRAISTQAPCSVPRLAHSPGWRDQFKYHWPLSWVCANYLQSGPTLCDPTDCSPPGSSDYGVLQARILFPVVMYGCESWTELWCWRTLGSPLDCKEIKPVHPKGNQSWIFTGRTGAEAPILWPSDEKRQLTGKDPNAGKD